MVSVTHSPISSSLNLSLLSHYLAQERVPLKVTPQCLLVPIYVASPSVFIIRKYIVLTPDFTKTPNACRIFLSILKGFNVYDHVEDKASPPPESIHDSNDVLVPSPAYRQWKQVDFVVFSLFQATVSNENLENGNM